MSGFGAAMADARLAATVRRFLEDGEELRYCKEVRRRGGLANFVWATLEITPPPPFDPPKKMAIAVTPTRLLILDVRGPWMDEAKGLLMEVPLDRIGAVERHGGINISRVMWNADGRDFTAWVDSARPLEHVLKGEPPLPQPPR